MARPIWKGHITFGLVNIPIILYSAEKKFDIQFKLIDSRDKAKIRYVRINEHTGEEVPWSEIAKGYEYDDNDYLVLEKKDINAIAGHATQSINIESFVNKGSLDCMIFDKPYYVVPDKKGEKGYVILRETLKNTKKVGIAKVMIHTREYLAALIVHENALILNLLRFHQELREPSEFDLPSDNIKTYKINSKEIDIAKQLLNSMTTQWEPEDYHDEFREALQELIEEKLHHEKPRKKHKKAPAAPKSNVINFVDLLRKSLKEKKNQKKSKPSHKRAKHT